MQQIRSDYARFPKRASGTSVTTASAAALWQVITAIGGDNGYYFLNSLWTARELLDWFIDGRGVNRGRRHPHLVQVGDKIDSWDVLGVETERRLILGLGMKAPGTGVLEFDITPEPAGRTRVTVTGYWHPAGLWGWLYWASLHPLHWVIFRGLARKICHRAERKDQLSADTARN